MVHATGVGGELSVNELMVAYFLVAYSNCMINPASAITWK